MLVQILFICAALAYQATSVMDEMKQISAKGELLKSPSDSGTIHSVWEHVDL